MPAGLFLFAIDAGAVPIVAPYGELPPCDAHSITLTEELGNPLPPPAPPFGFPGPFPIDEAIASESTVFQSTECAADPSQSDAPDFVVHILNMTPTYWTDLFFVADAGNFFNNHDGRSWATRHAHRYAGRDTPLISESMARRHL